MPSPNDRLSPHFLRSEFACNGTSCCGGTSAIDNRLIVALEAYRGIVGVPLHISSGFRCLAHNRAIGSKDTSQHPRGLAADILSRDIGAPDMLYLARESGLFGFVKGYDGWIHVDVGPQRGK